METTTTTTTAAEPEDEPFLDFTNPRILFGFVGGAFVLAIIIVGSLGLACCSGTPRKRRRNPNNHVQGNTLKTDQKNRRRRFDGEIIVPSPADGESQESVNIDPTLKKISRYITRKLERVLESITIEPDRIQKKDRLGSGYFGVVSKGILFSADKKTKREVALKTLASGDSEEQGLQQFAEEILQMTNLKHENVMPILGLVILEGHLHIVLPFMENGDLKTYISSHKQEFEVNDLLKMALQVTKGMHYLGQQNLIHGDLAARNCMMNKNRVVKVADFGLSRRLYQSEYYRSTESSNCPRPIRWMAIECIVENKFTIKSDVWSFGVLLWELMTKGKKRPYYDIIDNEIIPRVKNGYRLPRPKHCPDDVYEIMSSCWDKNPHNRPNFVDIINMIKSQITDRDQEYLVPE